VVSGGKPGISPGFSLAIGSLSQSATICWKTRGRRDD